jgi:polyferredoxin
MGVSLAVRTPYKVNVIRDRGVMARIVGGGKIENVYQLQVMNATEATQRYKVSVSGLPGLAVTSDHTLTVESTQQRRLVVRLQAPFEAAAPGTYPIEFRIESLDSPGNLVEKSVFMIPK